MSLRGVGLLTALLAGITLAFSGLTHAAAGRPGGALLSAAAGLALASVAAAALARPGRTR